MLYTFRICVFRFGCRWNISSHGEQNICWLHWSHFTLAFIDPHSSHFSMSIDFLPAPMRDDSICYYYLFSSPEVIIFVSKHFVRFRHTWTFNWLSIRILFITKLDNLIIWIGSDFFRWKRWWLCKLCQFIHCDGLSILFSRIVVFFVFLALFVFLLLPKSMRGMLSKYRAQCDACECYIYSNETNWNAMKLNEIWAIASSRCDFKSKQIWLLAKNCVRQSERFKFAGCKWNIFLWPVQLHWKFQVPSHSDRIRIFLLLWWRPREWTFVGVDMKSLRISIVNACDRSFIVCNLLLRLVVSPNFIFKFSCILFIVSEAENTIQTE